MLLMDRHRRMLLKLMEHDQQIRRTGSPAAAPVPIINRNQYNPSWPKEKESLNYPLKLTVGFD
jgi:hypothetical protein